MFNSIEEIERQFLQELEYQITALTSAKIEAEKTINDCLDKMRAIKNGEYRKAINGGKEEN